MTSKKKLSPNNWLGQSRVSYHTTERVTRKHVMFNYWGVEQGKHFVTFIANLHIRGKDTLTNAYLKDHVSGVCDSICVLILSSGFSISLSTSWPTWKKKNGYPRLNLNVQVWFALYGVGSNDTTTNTNRYSLLAPLVNTRTVKGKMDLQ